MIVVIIWFLKFMVQILVQSVMARTSWDFLCVSLEFFLCSSFWLLRWRFAFFFWYIRVLLVEARALACCDLLRGVILVDNSFGFINLWLNWNWNCSGVLILHSFYLYSNMVWEYKDWKWRKFAVSSMRIGFLLCRYYLRCFFPYRWVTLYYYDLSYACRFHLELSG